jgi:hypothetical protein
LVFYLFTFWRGYGGFSPQRRHFFQPGDRFEICPPFNVEKMFKIITIPFDRQKKGFDEDLTITTGNY